jgi:hypothetical protein
MPAPLAHGGLVTLLGGGYALYLALRRGRLSGVPTALAGWLLGSVLLALFAPSASAVLAGQVLLLWLLRTALYHTRPLAMLADLGLWGAGLLFALWAVARTGSLGLGVWCLFLSQIAFTWLPGVVGARGALPSPDRFEPAARAAARALRALARESSP